MSYGVMRCFVSNIDIRCQIFLVRHHPGIASVPEIEQDIDGHHDAVDRVQYDNQVEVKQRFMEYSGKIPNDDDEQENDAFTVIVFRAIGFIDGKGPGSPEAHQHDYFEYTHYCSVTIPFTYEIV